MFLNANFIRRCSFYDMVNREAYALLQAKVLGKGLRHRSPTETNTSNTQCCLLVWHAHSGRVYKICRNIMMTLVITARLSIGLFNSHGGQNKGNRYKPRKGFYFTNNMLIHAHYSRVIYCSLVFLIYISHVKTCMK